MGWATAFHLAKVKNAHEKNWYICKFAKVIGNEFISF